MTQLPHQFDVDSMSQNIRTVLALSDEDRRVVEHNNRHHPQFPNMILIAQHLRNADQLYRHGLLEIRLSTLSLVRTFLDMDRSEIGPINWPSEPVPNLETPILIPSRETPAPNHLNIHLSPSGDWIPSNEGSADRHHIQSPRPSRSPSPRIETRIASVNFVPTIEVFSPPASLYSSSPESSQTSATYYLAIHQGVQTDPIPNEPDNSPSMSLVAEEFLTSMAIPTSRTLSTPPNF